MKQQRNLIIVLSMIMVLLLTQCVQEVTEKNIPITTDSEKALALYEDGAKNMYETSLSAAAKLFSAALEEDPDFFMAATQLALLNNYYGEDEKYKALSETAINTEAKLSKGEKIMRSMLVKLLEDPQCDLADLSTELGELYPEDVLAYSVPLWQMSKNQDYEGIIEFTTKILDLVDTPAPFYNNLGYAYIGLEQYDKAKKAFDKYIELEPMLPNVYDSKGDFHMAFEEYELAYENFMKANALDSLWSMEKAMKAKAMFEEEVVEEELVE